MAWCCTEGDRAYVGDRPVIESLGNEISEIVGRPVYVELRRRLAPDDVRQGRSRIRSSPGKRSSGSSGGCRRRDPTSEEDEACGLMHDEQPKRSIKHHLGAEKTLEPRFPRRAGDSRDDGHGACLESDGLEAREGLLRCARRSTARAIFLEVVAERHRCVQPEHRGGSEKVVVAPDRERRHLDRSSSCRVVSRNTRRKAPGSCSLGVSVADVHRFGESTAAIPSGARRLGNAWPSAEHVDIDVGTPARDEPCDRIRSVDHSEVVEGRGPVPESRNLVIEPPDRADGEGQLPPEGRPQRRGQHDRGQLRRPAPTVPPSGRRRTRATLRARGAGTTLPEPRLGTDADHDRASSVPLRAPLW